MLSTLTGARKKRISAKPGLPMPSTGGTWARCYDTIAVTTFGFLRPPPNESPTPSHGYQPKSRCHHPLPPLPSPPLLRKTSYMPYNTRPQRHRSLRSTPTNEPHSNNLPTSSPQSQKTHPWRLLATPAIPPGFFSPLMPDTALPRVVAEPQRTSIPPNSSAAASVPRVTHKTTHIVSQGSQTTDSDTSTYAAATHW